MSSSLARQTLVLVNNEDNTRMHAEAALRRAGYAVRTYAGAAPALAELAALPADLVILDWYNPPLHRLELWQRLRHAHPDLKVIYLSPHADDIADLLKHEHHPPAAVVALPCLFDRALVGAVNRCLALDRDAGAFHR